ncbi:helix-turn-helix transcriptional regulator [Jiella sonneratiae]|uniref:LuxR family transcriptional regulator n=1 Tax=Jiella sonneratiae TaxID=2816856 RepID=A0ABS3IYT6_9HYPH|nr:LuxR family transcriptional regulator [Jiella sonneratiae]MBO0902578.1 LuxR family transcriptional regulator [Jiella sonneratiae]
MGQYATDEMFRFVDCIQHLEDQDAIATELFKTVRPFGFTSYGISGLPRPNESVEPYFLLSGWQPEWFDRYVRNDYVHFDPVIAHTTRTDAPFTWEEACSGRKISADARKVMDEATAFGMRQGLTVPIYTLGGLSAVVTFGGDRIELSGRERGALHMIAIYAHSQIRRLASRRRDDEADRAPFSARERECVLWCAEGKTNWEIGRITGLSEKTIESYLRNASQKVGAMNRAQLVAESFRQRRIA